MHYYKFNIADWNLGTAHLSLAEEAVYFRLVNFYYDTESPISLDTLAVFRRLRVGNDVELAQSILEEFFTQTDKGWIHNRCDETLKEYRKTIKKNRANGAGGGRPKKDAACVETQEKPSGLFSETQVEPKHNPNQEPLTTNQEPLTSLKEIAPQADAGLIIGNDDSTTDKQKKPTPPKFKPESLAETMPPQLGEWWLKWIVYRRDRKLSTKEPTWKAQANNLNEWGKAGHDPCQAIKASIDNGWAGLFEPKPKNQGANYANQPKPSLIDRFISNNYPAAENDYGSMGGDDRAIRGEVVKPVRGITGQIGPMDTDLIGDFKATGGGGFE